MKKLFLIVALVCASTPAAGAADLFRVTLHGVDDADVLRSLPGLPVVRAGNDYLMVGGPALQAGLQSYGLDHERLATAVDTDQLALDRRLDRRNVERYRVLYEQGGLRLLQVPAETWRTAATRLDLMPVRPGAPRILYTPPVRPRPAVWPDAASLDSLVGEINQDSVTAYLYYLQAFNGRVAGTPSNLAARDWLVTRFQDFGYDSVYTDRFYANIFGTNEPYYNVVAVKEGTVHPDVQILVGAHFDGVSGSPAVDDNGTGTAAVLELARVLSDRETAVSFVFVTFDAEEWGLYGSWHHAIKARSEGDQILLMFNMDMIGHITNSAQARLYYGASSLYAQQWINTAPPWSGITGLLSGSSTRSDHYPFDQMGFMAVFLQEYNFSTVYHTHQDSTRFINFDYVTRMIKGSAAALYTLSEGGDFDLDGLPNDSDNCILIANVGQDDADADGWGDVCDNCYANYNPGQQDADGDALGDLCDVCPFDFANDEDGDGACANEDNCPGEHNPEQQDIDGDGQGDACQFTPPSWTLEGESSHDSLGFSVDAGGDVNDDGYDDLIVGAPGAAAGSGEAYVFSGADQSLLYRITGEDAHASLGWSVAIVGDLNGDLFDDFVVGAPYYDDPAGFWAGRAHVFLGGTGSFPETLQVADAYHTFTGASMAEFVGSDVCAVGDVDGDTVVDLAISAARLQGLIAPGEVSVYSGKTLSHLYTVTGEMTGDRFGYAVAAAGDINGDARPDFIVGAPNNSAGGSESGRAYVFSGPDGALLMTFTGSNTQGQLGYAVGGVGDLNADGRDDLIVGAPFDIMGGFRSGRVMVYSGLDSGVIYAYPGHTPGDGLGTSVGSIGDVDGDSVPDMIISAWQKVHVTLGRVHVYSGRTGSLIHTYIGEELFGGFGFAICGNGDLDQDGLSELVVGSFWKDGSEADAGQVYGFGAGDPDADGLTGASDNCPLLYNPGQENFDGDGFGDLCDVCPAFATPGDVGVATGNVNGDASITATDIIYAVQYVLQSGPEPLPIAEAGDVNCDDAIDMTDLVYLVLYVFKGGPEPCDVCALAP